MGFSKNIGDKLVSTLSLNALGHLAIANQDLDKAKNCFLLCQKIQILMKFSYKNSLYKSCLYYKIVIK